MGTQKEYRALTDRNGKPYSTKETGAAVANATDAASAITQLNALLASLRAAKVIAP